MPNINQDEVSEQALVGPPSVASNAVVVLVHEPPAAGGIEPIWLALNGHLPESGEVESLNITKELIHLQTKLYHLLILQGRLQFTILQPWAPEAPALVESIAQVCINALPQTKWIAIGFNFGAFIPPTAEISFAKWNRDKLCDFSLENLPFLSQDDARFGRYFSFDAFGFRVRVQAMPQRVTLQTTGELPLGFVNPLPDNSEALGLTLNFNRNITDRAELAEPFRAWEASANIFQKVLNSFL